MGKLFVVPVLMLVSACSTEFTSLPCAVDSDCDHGAVCELRAAQPVCVQAADAPIIIGQSSPFTGSNQALGVGMKLGIQLAFDEQNAAGGIRGRQLKLVIRDDGYDPLQAEANARVLVNAQPSNAPPRCPNTATPVSNGALPPVMVPVSTTALERGPDAVLAMLGNVGTPTAVRAAPVAIEAGTLFFGAFTGATTLLRDTSAGPCAQYIFNVRASYGQEARATMEYFLNRGVTDYRALISFDQNDTFGNAGYSGLVAAYVAERGEFPSQADPTTPIARFRYTRNDVNSVPVAAVATEAYLASLLQTFPNGTVGVGIMMTDTYGASSTYIQHLRTWQYANDTQQTDLKKATRLVLHFSNVSFVGPNALAEELVSAGTVATPNGPMALTNDVAVSQVVPNYQTDLSDVVQRYNALVAADGAAPGFTSLEGYISARVFIGGLLNHQGPFTPEGLIKAFETLPDLELGIGANAGFSATNHQYSQSVWGTVIQPDGGFKDLYFWTVGSPIQFFQ
ncbi:MAG: ABC transporter substrate-binding protein [Deltaproteobacteria bacterium]|nr:ABC transporter substrate-binding protein [Deltaproteobacteria bacterium]